MNPTQEVAVKYPWLDWIDRWCERIGDAANPIMVKEARQALKSKQFILTFSALLVAALGWTVIGSLSMMPQIYTSPSAPRMLTGYYFVLAVPMLLVVPMAAYRSLEGEIDDGTLELLSISALGPWQIVLGKLASAALQMALYFVALFPCVAYAYNLRGVDLPTILMMLGILLVAGIMLTVAAVFMAAISSSRTGRITSLFVVIAALLVAQWILGAMVISLINLGNPLSDDALLFALVAVIAISLSIGHLLLTATAAQLTPESENRSTRIRIAMLLVGAVLIGLDALALQTLDRRSLDVIIILSMGAGGLWAVAGSMMAAESSVQTPRIRRELPQSLLARCTLTWLTPGPSTGLVFAVINVVLLTVVTCVGIDTASGRLPWQSRLSSVAPATFATAAAYLVGFLVMVRYLVAIIRTRFNPRAEVGLIVLIMVALAAAMIPYGIASHLNDYREFRYSASQATNWLWTLSEISEGNDCSHVMVGVTIVSLVGFLAALIASADVTLPRRTALPARVAEELDRSGPGGVANADAS